MFKEGSEWDMLLKNKTKSKNLRNLQKFKFTLVNYGVYKYLNNNTAEKFEHIKYEHQGHNAIY